MLRELCGVNRVILACGRTDLRRGIDGLVSIIRLKYGLEPLEPGTLFLFCGCKRGTIKGIIYDEDGFLMLTKRLSNGGVYQWPRNSDEARTLSKDEFNRFLDGFSLDSSIPKSNR